MRIRVKNVSLSLSKDDQKDHVNDIPLPVPSYPLER